MATGADRYYAKARWALQGCGQVQIWVREVRIKDRMHAPRFRNHNENRRLWPHLKQPTRQVAWDGVVLATWPSKYNEDLTKGERQ